MPALAMEWSALTNLTRCGRTIVWLSTRLWSSRPSPLPKPASPPPSTAGALCSPPLILSLEDGTTPRLRKTSTSCPQSYPDSTPFSSSRTSMTKLEMQVHMNAAADTAAEGELSISFMKKYIAYCRSRCGPRLEQAAAEKLKNKYVLMRNSSREVEEEGEKRLAIPITVRQLEAVVRISESLAKMELQPFANDAYVDEAIRIFQVSSLSAAHSGDLQGAEGFTTEEDQELIFRIEKQLKKRFAIGSQVSQHTILQAFAKQKYPERQVQKVLATMIRRGELQHRMQRKMLYRLK